MSVKNQEPKKKPSQQAIDDGKAKLNEAFANVIPLKDVVPSKKDFSLNLRILEVSPVRHYKDGAEQVYSVIMEDVNDPEQTVRMSLFGNDVVDRTYAGTSEGQVVQLANPTVRVKARPEKFSNTSSKYAFVWGEKTAWN